MDLSLKLTLKRHMIMLNDLSYNLFWKKKDLRTNGEVGYMDVYFRSLILSLLMEDLGENLVVQED